MTNSTSDNTHRQAHLKLQLFLTELSTDGSHEDYSVRSGILRLDNCEFTRLMETERTVKEPNLELDKLYLTLDCGTRSVYRPPPPKKKIK